MRKMVLFYMIVTLLSGTVVASETTYGIEVEGLDSLYTEIESYGIDPEGGLDKGLVSLWEQGISLVDSILRGSMKTAILLLAVVLFCGLAETVEGPQPLSVVSIVGALAVTRLSVGEVGTMIYLGQETIEKMSYFSTGLLPVMTILTTATGNLTGAVARQGATVLFSGILISIIHQILLPLIYAYMALCCANASIGNEGLKKIAEFIKSTVIGFLTSFLIVFVGYLTMSGTIAGSADLVAIRTTKIALSRAVPVVGGILSDASEMVLVGAGVLKGSVGVAGMLAVLAICLVPFLELSIHYLSYKITAALAGTVANPKLSGLIEQISSAFGLILGMTGTCALLLLVSIVSSVSVVMT
ncbi:MAG: stage III sporulation protein AE [Eubacteriales bacterium]